ncbi:cytochrome c biogenesis protein CcsA [Aliiglaciecola sp. CAU 1673]|uniref:cytochrome C assembly family protein n=1 Tax=Aliiglaciecola sp. CAU 1673 TaxID=3032595 RepID=UPI0023DC5E1C|nr:cytochrome c biogenesis protein CcsA [Aliiglaciecola sp. CAU 1673]MDF2177131.1 cytochrome c biogenesis protein CcsA [Aliiglaciecola sp. CAU 1673]
MHWLGILASVLYIVAAAQIAARLFHHEGPSRKLTTAVASLAVVLHLFALIDAIFASPGQNMSITNVACLVAWMIALAMTIASFNMANAIMLPVVYGFAALILLITQFLPDTYLMHIEMQPGLIAHITLALFAYGCLMIGMLYALQLGYINFRLKQRPKTLLHSSLPPLMIVERILFKLLLVGTVLLTLSLISGFVFLEDMFAQHQAHKTVLSIVAWLVFVILLAGHHRLGWRGKPVAIATIVGALLLTLAYFGSRFVKEVLLGM